MLTYTLRVMEIRQETGDTVTLCFKQPGLKKIKYLPGQYLTLIFRINGRRYIRPYSFSSAPVVDALLEVTIKRVPGGIVSNHIHDTIKIDDIIEVMPPLGDFVYDRILFPNVKNIVLWGAGSGITPLMSIIKYALSLEDAPGITLVYGNRNYETVIFLDAIRRLHDAYPNKLSIWHFHTQLSVSDQNPYLVQGRINPSKVLSVMKATGDIENSIHYICGPVGLKESVKASLKDLGADESQIFTEDFELVKNPKDFEDINTRFIQIFKDQQTHKVEVVKGRSILEAGLDSSLELSYSCQTGNCSVCKGQVTSGEVKMIGLDKRPADLKVNEYLLCCTYPLTDDVCIAVD
jgi:ring-1,2-phenylacetyl-CoA epoxidase subunit PaaE